jgi:hypothetical protein
MAAVEESPRRPGTDYIGLDLTREHRMGDAPR